jgi:hypothetical protein
MSAIPFYFLSLLDDYANYATAVQRSLASILKNKSICHSTLMLLSIDSHRHGDMQS